MRNDTEAVIAAAASKAAPIFAEKGWTWWNTRPLPPTEAQIRDALTELLEYMEREDATQAETGRLGVKLIDGRLRIYAQGKIDLLASASATSPSPARPNS